MKKIIAIAAFLISATLANAQNWNNTTWVNPYINNQGGYVGGYYRTSPNNTNWDNFSTVGNTNYYTGSEGTRARDYSQDAYNYGVGQTIYTGPSGGQYYINSNGNKVYVPKR